MPRENEAKTVVEAVPLSGRKLLAIDSMDFVYILDRGGYPIARTETKHNGVAAELAEVIIRLVNFNFYHTGRAEVLGKIADRVLSEGNGDRDMVAYIIGDELSKFAQGK